MCQINTKFTSVSQSLPDATMSQQEMCMMHVQALTHINTPKTWFDRNGNLKGGDKDLKIFGGNQGFSKHASKMQTEYKGS